MEKDRGWLVFKRQIGKPPNLLGSGLTFGQSEWVLKKEIHARKKSKDKGELIRANAAHLNVEDLHTLGLLKVQSMKPWGML